METRSGRFQREVPVIDDIIDDRIDEHGGGGGGPSLAGPTDYPGTDSEFNQVGVSTKAARSDHTHNGATIDQLNSGLADKSNVGHVHDDRYYTEAEITTFLSGKSDTSHNHDSRYYTESEIDTFLAGKANTSHTHAISDVTSLQAGLDAKQTLDSDLTAIAALSASNDDIIQRKSGAWTNRTIAQFKTDLSLATVATSGSYNDLTNKPAASSGIVFPLSNYQSGWHSGTINLDDCRDTGSIAEVWMTRITVPAGMAVNNVGTFLKAAGTLGAGGQNGFAIYSDDGATQYFTVSDDTLWTTAGPRIKSLGGSSIAAQSAAVTYRVAINVRGMVIGPDIAFTALQAALTEYADKRCRYGPASFPAAGFDPLTFGNSTGGYIPFIALGS